MSMSSYTGNESPPALQTDCLADQPNCMVGGVDDLRVEGQVPDKLL